MNHDSIIQVDHLSKCFKFYHKPWTRALEWIRFGRKVYHEDFWALKDVSFEVKRGECVGVIGPNGAGKSTLLKILSRSMYPTTGTFHIRGDLLSLLELGTGFNQELTGRQNVYRSSQLLGFPEDYVSQRIRDIEDFCDIGEFFDRPVKTYSSGMYVRLAFSMFVFLEPEILIVDEVLSVGDIFFQQKCATKIQQILANGTTLLLVTHDLAAIANLCHRVILMGEGQVVAIGPPKPVMEKYTALVFSRLTAGNPVTDVHSGVSRREISPDPSTTLSSPVTLAPIPQQAFRFGDGGMRILNFSLHTQSSHTIAQCESGEVIRLTLEIQCNESGLAPSVGFQFRDRFGNLVSGTNTRMQSFTIPVQDRGKTFRITFDIKVMLGSGEYTLTCGVASDDAKPERIYDWVDQLTSFVVVAPKTHRVDGLVYCPVTVSGLTTLNDGESRGKHESLSENGSLA